MTSSDEKFCKTNPLKDETTDTYSFQYIGDGDISCNKGTLVPRHKIIQ